MARNSFIALCIIGVALIVLTLVLSPWETSVPISEAPKSVIAERVILEHSVGKDSTVSYSYAGDLIPGLLVEGEILKLRTSGSYSRLVSTSGEGEKKTYTVSVISFPEQTFVELPSGWHFVEHATTTLEEWQKNTSSLIDRLEALVIPIAHAVDFYSAAGDGDVTASGSDSGIGNCSVATAWSQARTASSGTANHTATTFIVRSAVTRARDNETNEFFCDAEVRRVFLPFDTSAIPRGSSISAATLNVYATAKVNTDNDGIDYVTVSTSTQDTHLSLTGTDFNEAGPTLMDAGSEAIDSGQRKDITSISTGAYLVFTLNAAGIAAIKMTAEGSTCSTTGGITCLCLREGHDAENNRPANNTEDSVTFSSSENTGTSQDPYLAITYTAGTNFAPWLFWGF